MTRTDPTRGIRKNAWPNPVISPEKNGLTLRASFGSMPKQTISFKGVFWFHAMMIDGTGYDGKINEGGIYCIPVDLGPASLDQMVEVYTWCLTQTLTLTPTTGELSRNENVDRYKAEATIWLPCCSPVYC